jgi:hypothetical protein
MPDSLARAASMAGLAVPYRIEYDDATCRWANSAGLLILTFPLARAADDASVLRACLDTP